MIDDSLKQDYIRAKTEQRMQPMLRLRRRQAWLLLFALGFMLLTFLTNALSGSEIGNILQPLLWICFALGMIQMVRFIFEFQHEMALQKEISREMELERLRLLYDLAYSHQVNEKLKNSVKLTDDGELIPNDELANKHLHQ